ncbi:FkbM family methyltransferase [Sulfitobacter albidus]|uniref:FkbM family methyltransferase n=1 Tax=Sulfitobacter albidus TaxID=2829501 RepID=A0A975PP04_9RHOB|nr:FkbM family methyltransferase [Sulfitobacter albidus]QUJ77870.1 FkbM family methyltransferase [Sulfitobacter albidus]
MDGSPPPNQKNPYVVCNGIRFPKDGHFITGRIRGALRKNAYEAKETEAVLRVVREGDTVIELGAGIGYMSSLIASKRKVTAVHSFEANPALIPYIQSVHAANELDNCHITHAILGARKGRADFYARANVLSSSLSPLEGDTPEKVQKVSVDVLNAKQTFRDTGANVLVCDIEGAEADLLPALDLSKLRAAVIELHPQIVGPEGINKVFRAMMDGGLAYYARGSTNKVVSFRRAW